MANAARTGIQPTIFHEGQMAPQAGDETDRVPKEILFDLLTTANRNQSGASQSLILQKMDCDDGRGWILEKAFL